ncbi:MAG: hypothetical protein HYZ34_10595 [Ignavibacteriae bacterium]|nr:hypothetical protein [Ignavibacteriota bacterium]
MGFILISICCFWIVFSGCRGDKKQRNENTTPRVQPLTQIEAEEKSRIDNSSKTSPQTNNFSSDSVKNEKSFRDYTIKIHSTPDSEWIEILKSGNLLHFQSGWKLNIGSLYEEEKGGKSWGVVGTDVTGDAIPDLMISDYSGGAHC